MNKCIWTRDRQGNLIPPRNTLGGPLTGPDVKQGPVIPSHCGEHVSPGKLNNPVPTVKNHTVLDDEIDLEDELKTPVGNRKHVSWQTSINDQRQKLRVQCI